jgi:PAS domain S-box-containing protein
MTSVLVLDHRTTDRELLARILGHEGYGVLEASTGEEALGLARADRPDLIIANILMPTMDGYEFVRELGTGEATSNIPVIFCTATYGANEVRRLAEACGVSHILVKPYERAEVLGVVAAELSAAREPALQVPAEEFAREHLRVLNAKLIETVEELETANREQEETQALQSVVMQNMAEGLFVTDGEDRLTFMNSAASRMLGWDADELAGKPVHTAIHSHRDGGAPCQDEECELLNAGTRAATVTVAEDLFTRSDGTTLPVAYSVAPLLTGSTGRGVVVVFRDATADQADRTRVQRELDALSWVGRTRDALDEGRLVLYAQPIVPLSTGDPRQELLLRMVGRGGEIIPPGRFLPAAEKYGVIGEIDQWVVAQAIQLAGAGRHVEVNLSAESIGSPELLAVIEHQLGATGADASKIVFEITETALMRDIKAGEAFTHYLVKLGCGLALDDFGTGFGSFTYLKTLPVDYLKIDIEFVRNLPSNLANQHLVKAVVNLAHGFGKQTIAEGVEDEESVDLLRDYGVDFAQGYYLGRPAPIGTA